MTSASDDRCGGDKEVGLEAARQGGHYQENFAIQGGVMPYDISHGGNLTTGRENGQELLATQRGKLHSLTDLN